MSPSSTAQLKARFRTPIALFFVVSFQVFFSIQFVTLNGFKSPTLIVPQTRQKLDKKLRYHSKF